MCVSLSNIQHCFLFLEIYINAITLNMRTLFKLLFWDEKEISVNLLLMASFICLQFINFIDIGMYVSKF